jgi:hypothetical protein
MNHDERREKKGEEEKKVIKASSLRLHLEPPERA